MLAIFLQMETRNLRVWSIYGAIFFLTIFCCCIDSTVSRAPYPLGVNLGRTCITAAYFTATDQPVTVASVKGTKAYQAYMTDTLENEGKRILHDAKRIPLLAMFGGSKLGLTVCPEDADSDKEHEP